MINLLRCRFKSSDLIDELPVEKRHLSSSIKSDDLKRHLSNLIIIYRI